MVSAAAFIEQVIIPYVEHWGYIYGQWGAVWTYAKQNAATREMTVKYGSKWVGKKVTDCSGLIRRALYNLGESIVHHARYQYTEYCGPKGKLVNGLREDGTRPLPGSAVFLQGKEKAIHHVGVYVGCDTCIEAKGTVYGVVTSHLNHWDHWGQLTMVDYTDAAALETDEPIQAPDEDSEAGTVLTAIVNNPQNWLNVRSLPKSDASVVFKVQKGTVVDVLDAGEPEWWQIRYGGRIGWAFAKYLKVIGVANEQPDNPEPLPPVEETPVPEQPPEPSEKDDKQTEVWNELLYVRTALNDLSDRISKLMTVIDGGEG